MASPMVEEADDSLLFALKLKSFSRLIPTVLFSIRRSQMVAEHQFRPDYCKVDYLVVASLVVKEHAFSLTVLRVEKFLC